MKVNAINMAALYRKLTKLTAVDNSDREASKTEQGKWRFTDMPACRMYTLYSWPSF